MFECLDPEGRDSGPKFGATSLDPGLLATMRRHVNLFDHVLEPRKLLETGSPRSVLSL